MDEFKRIIHENLKLIYLC